MGLLRNRPNIWFFGDSFCEFDDNWVSIITQQVNAKIQHLGTGGASIPHLLERLNKFEFKIKKNDYVVVCISDPYRHYLGKLHLLNNHLTGYLVNHTDAHTPFDFVQNARFNSGIEKEVLYSDKGKAQTLDILCAFKNYVDHLYDKDSQVMCNRSIVSYIVNTFLPNLATKNVIYLYTINRDVYTNSKYFFNSDAVPVSFWELLIEYFLRHENIGDLTTIKNKTASNNHWVNSLQWEELFWRTYNPIFKTIGAEYTGYMI